MTLFFDDFFFEYLFNHSGAQQIAPIQQKTFPNPELVQQVQQL